MSLLWLKAREMKELEVSVPICRRCDEDGLTAACEECLEVLEVICPECRRTLWHRTHHGRRCCHHQQMGPAPRLQSITIAGLAIGPVCGEG